MTAPSAQLPDLYQPWIEALIGGPLPAETGATCDRCAMLPAASTPGSSAAALPRFFDPRVKCCTYLPAVPNFLVGRILLDDDPQMARGRASVEARIDAEIGVTPAGLEQPVTFELLYDRGGQETFGRSIELRCPHYDSRSGACGIWRHRNAICSTWFCKYVRGSVGERFWTSLRDLLRAVERALIAFSVHRLNPGPAALHHVVGGRTGDVGRPLLTADVDRVPDRARARALWGRYAGRERDFFLASARLVEPLSWTQVRELGGAELEVAAALVQETALELTSFELPARLRARAVQIEPAGPDHALVSGYRAYDPLLVPKALVDVLHVFDGRPVPVARRGAAAAGLSVDRRAIRRLVDFGILEDAENDPVD